MSHAIHHRELPLPKRMYSKERGYFAFPMIEEDLELEDFDAWEAFSDHVERAKAGDFSTISSLLEIYDHDAHWVRRGAYIKLMGDAGSDALCGRIHQLLRSDIPYDYCWDFAELLFYWGRLDVVPTLIEGWRGSHAEQDAAFVPPRLSLLLEAEPGPLLDYPLRGTDEEADVYRARVYERYELLRAELGDQAFVFRGRQLSPAWIAECALAELAQGKIAPEMRLKLEAMTGVDCSPFYGKGGLQPLAAAVVLEDMLANPDLARFEPGQRYFFGRPIPAR